jgi:hypothetical protein
MAVDDATQTNLLDRWIVDPGSNTHVVNSEAWKGWKKTSNNLERCSTNAGNSCILITAWGTMKLVARTLHRQLTLELTHVAYVEGFLTSVLGLARCQTESIHLDSGRDVLYMHQPTYVIAQLEYNGGHWLIDAELSRRPPLLLLHSLLSTFWVSSRLSYTSRWLILFVYVDDIVMAFHRSNANLHRSFKKDLVDLYSIKAMGDLT